MAVKKKVDTKKLVILALMLALTIIFCFVPISFGPVTLALMILPTLIVAQTEDLGTTAILGFFLGIVNYIAWFTTKAALLLAPIFQNPLVCILPRVMIGIAAWLLRKGLGRLLLKAKYEVTEDGKERLTNKAYLVSMEQIIVVVSTAVGVLVNTVFVGLFTLIFYNNTVLSTSTTINIEFVMAWFGLNFLIEVISFSLITPTIVFALRKAKLVAPETYHRAVKKPDTALGDNL